MAKMDMRLGTLTLPRRIEKLLPLEYSLAVFEQSYESCECFCLVISRRSADRFLPYGLQAIDVFAECLLDICVFFDAIRHLPPVVTSKIESVEAELACLSSLVITWDKDAIFIGIYN